MSEQITFRTATDKSVRQKVHELHLELIDERVGRGKEVGRDDEYHRIHHKQVIVGLLLQDNIFSEIEPGILCTKVFDAVTVHHFWGPHFDKACSEVANLFPELTVSREEKIAG